MPNPTTPGATDAEQPSGGADAERSSVKTDGDRAPNDPRRAEPFEEIERGLRFNNLSLMVARSHLNQAIVDGVALAELLMERGVFSSEEYEAARQRAREQVDQLAHPRTYLVDMGDKYAEGETVEIDCASRIPLCQARCCSFTFVLTAQDLDEGVARWDYGNPYWIRHGPDGYCVHCDPETRACAIHDRRPHVCRKFDCREDKRIWIDFEKRIPAPFKPPPADPPIAMARPELPRPAGASTDEAGPAEPSGES